MKISLEWLRDYIEVTGTAQETADTLSDLGFPCEGIEQFADDTVIDVEVTSNRGDCLGHIGVARELSVATGKPLTLPAIQLDEMDKDAAEFVSVDIEAPELCGRYTARMIEGVSVGPAPRWMAKRLEAIGLRSVNNVVDATNYALMETGQPPHAFDFAKIDQGRIAVRRARKGESLVSIDATKCELTEDMLVIADARGPVAIAGVMGGLDSEVSDATTTVLLEDAHFDPVTVRTASRRLVLPSDAAFRFERIVDRDMIDWASKRTAQLITQVAGGRVARGMVDCYPGHSQPKQVVMRLARLKHLLGIDVPIEDVLRILQALGFNPNQQASEVTCTVPSWRSDIYREVDVIEEVVRCYGFDRLPTEQRIEIQVTPMDARHKAGLKAIQALQCHGYYETISVDFVDDVTADLFAYSKGHLAVKDSARKQANKLRQSLLGSLLTVLKTNLHAKNLPCRVFEKAGTFLPGGDDQVLPTEHTQVALVADDDFRSLRSAVEGVIETFVSDADIRFEPADLAWAEAGAHIQVNGTCVGQAGVFSEKVKAKLDIKNAAAVGAELDFDVLMAAKNEERQIKPIPRFPAIERDLSIVVNEQVVWAEIVSAIEAQAPEVLEDIEFVEIYRGKGIASGSKSLTLTMRFRDLDGTLKHEVVDGYQQSIVQGLIQAVQAQLRDQ